MGSRKRKPGDEEGKHQRLLFVCAIEALPVYAGLASGYLLRHHIQWGSQQNRFILLSFSACGIICSLLLVLGAFFALSKRNALQEYLIYILLAISIIIMMFREDLEYVETSSLWKQVGMIVAFCLVSGFSVRRKSYVATCGASLWVVLSVTLLVMNCPRGGVGFFKLDSE
jgi:hypothetical protein